MYLFALKMLLADRAKFFALLLAIASSAFLISQQVAIFTGLMVRTTSQVRDMPDAPVWVMDPGVRYVDEIKSLPDTALSRVRSVEGVRWAVRLYKGYAKATGPAGDFRQAILLGIDDATLTGLPREMILGSAEDLRVPHGIVLDDQGFRSLFPGRPLELGGEVEVNDRRGVVVGICKPSPPFQTFPVMYTTYSNAMSFVGVERTLLSFVLAAPSGEVSRAELAERITRATGLKALPAERFAWDTILYYVANTGIPVNFGITIAVAVVVGLAISGQTLMLFVLDNIKQFAALKAIGAGDGLLARMVVLQAGVVGVLGLGLGLGGAAVFFEATREIPHLRGFILRPFIVWGTSGLILIIAIVSSVLAVRRVLAVEPATVFRG